MKARLILCLVSTVAFGSDIARGAGEQGVRALAPRDIRGATEAALDPRPTRERLEVEEVFATPGGSYVVILRTRLEPFLYLPIEVGESEAIVIRMRLDRQTPPRPMTLNLLEAVLNMNKLKVQEISIDSWKAGLFLGRIRLKSKDKAYDLDARPSDAIGLATGKDIPIWATRQVLDSAAIDPRTLEDVPEPDAGSYGETAPEYEETL